MSYYVTLVSPNCRTSTIKRGENRSIFFCFLSHLYISMDKRHNIKSFRLLKTTLCIKNKILPRSTRIPCPLIELLDIFSVSRLLTVDCRLITRVVKLHLFGSCEASFSNSSFSENKGDETLWTWSNLLLFFLRDLHVYNKWNFFLYVTRYTCLTAPAFKSLSAFTVSHSFPSDALELDSLSLAYSASKSISRLSDWQVAKQTPHANFTPISHNT